MRKYQALSVITKATNADSLTMCLIWATNQNRAKFNQILFKSVQKIRFGKQVGFASSLNKA